MGLSTIPNETDYTRKWKTQLSFQASVSEENECRVTVEIREYFAQQLKRHPLLNEFDLCSCNALQNNNIDCGERAEKKSSSRRREAGGKSSPRLKLTPIYHVTSRAHSIYY
ncbi:hypothetical protein CDAR_180981 [Caerostris darwini]|uniref:Uncharacterized protein n=1 Tax=Caerostris darwini TaxID=1538125 RepID=A0AAV4TVL0_9ARAC|nr:hypothetical protein CDAR_180981 [Caerostris darwini]